MSERKRIIYSAVTLGLVATITGIFLVGKLLPFPAKTLDQFAVAKTTTAAESAVVTGVGEYTKRIELVATETTPHGDAHGYGAAMIPQTLVLTASTSGIPWNEVWVGDHEFYPTIKTIPLGTELTWINREGRDHTVTSATGLFDWGLTAGEKISYIFDKPGVYEYYCIPHDGMTGQIIVSENMTPPRG